MYRLPGRPVEDGSERSLATIPQVEPEALVKNVLPTEAHDLVGGGAPLVDVREAPEWAEARIPGAQWMPMSTIGDWHGDLPRDGPVVVYCRTGVRSHAVVGALATRLGLSNLVNMAGGIVAWAAAGLPIEATPFTRHVINPAGDRPHPASDG
jgi:rhodanese-related sulfurtransferase